MARDVESPRHHLYYGAYLKNIVAGVRIRWRSKDNSCCQKCFLISIHLTAQASYI